MIPIWLVTWMIPFWHTWTLVSIRIFIWAGVKYRILWALFQFFTQWFFATNIQIRGWHDKIRTAEIENEAKLSAIELKKASEISKIELKNTSKICKIKIKKIATSKPSQSSKATNLNEMSIKTAQTLVRKEMRTKQARLADQFWKIEQHKRRYSSSCYGKEAGYFVEGGCFESLASKPRMKKFSNGFNNAVCHMLTFLPDDEPIKLVQNVNLIQGKTKTIDFTGVVWDLNNLSKKNLSKENSGKIDSVPTVSSIFQTVYHMTSSNQTCLVSDTTNENLNVCFSNDDCLLTNDRSDLN